MSKICERLKVLMICYLYSKSSYGYNSGRRKRDEPKTACIRTQKKLKCISTHRKLLKPSSIFHTTRKQQT